VIDETVFPFSNLPSSESPSTNNLFPISLDQFENYAYAPSLLPNHGAGTERGARLELLDEPIPSSPGTPIVATRSTSPLPMQPLGSLSPVPGHGASPRSTSSSATPPADPVLAGPTSPVVSHDPTSSVDGPASSVHAPAVRASVSVSMHVPSPEPAPLP
jgi:hypothetical protein